MVQEDLLEHILGAEQEALKQAEYIKKSIGYEVKIETEYKDLEKIKYDLEKNKIKIVKIEYKENIELSIEIAEDKINLLENLDLKTEISTKKYVEI